jgi:hypothetical protein
MYSESRAVGKGMKATHIKTRMFITRKPWSEREISRKRLWWFAHTIPRMRKLITYAIYEGHKCASPSRSDPCSPTWGTPISMTRSVIAMANTPSEKTSILPVSLSRSPLAVIGLPLYVVTR